MASLFNPFTLPSLTTPETFRIPFNKGIGKEEHQFFDVKCYPYRTGDLAPIFAVVGCVDVLIYRATSDDQGYLSILHALVDQESRGADGLPVLNTCTWAFIHQSEPLLAVSGASGEIKIIKALSDELLITLVGHGAGLINDLVTHPLYPWILASGSLDSSIRIWDLRRWNDKKESPCVIICGQGQGHKEGILKLAWHDTGKYLISGAHDNKVCIWTIPDLSEESSFWSEISKENRKKKSDAATIIHYPHFVSHAIHRDYVDCVAFYGDFIISKASTENQIALWKITGFDSNLPRPHPDLAPKTQEHKDTRSGFIRQPRNVNTNGSNVSEDDRDQPLYSRYLTFHLPDAEVFYIRFGLLTPSSFHPELHSVLVCGNMKSKIFFWDLSRLDLGHTNGFKTVPHNPPRHETYIENYKPKAPKKRKGGPLDQRTTTPTASGSPASSTPKAGSTDSPSHHRGSVFEPDRMRYKLSDPHAPLMPHKTITLPNAMKKNEYDTCFRAVSWSACGKWCIAVGESGPDQKKDGIGAFMTRWL